MGESTFLDNIKEFIGKLSFKVFLWSINMTQDEYIKEIVKQESATT